MNSRRPERGPRSRSRWRLAPAGLPAAALLAACSASPGNSYAISDEETDGSVVDAATTPPDATDAGHQLPPDTEAGTAIRDAGADGSVDDATADAESPPAPLTLLRLEGRWDRSLPDSPRAAYPGARITMHFFGTGAVLRLRERTSASSLAGTSQWSVTIDAVPQPVLVTEVTAGNTARDYTLAAGLAAGEHTIQLVRRTEAEFGSTQVVDVTVTDGSMLAPPARPQRRIEFVGDSNMSGYGVEVTRPMNPGDPVCSHTPSNQNFEKAFPSLVAARFGAETETVIHSGKGALYNLVRSDLDTLPVLYPRAVPSEPETLYDATTFAADAVVVLVGGNDFAERPANDYPTESQVRTAYDGLVGQIRTAHPDALIVATLSPGVSDTFPIAPWGSVAARTKIRSAIKQVVSFRTQAGDQKLVFHEFAEATGDQLTACHYHPSAAFHQTLASSVGDVMAARLAW